MSMAPPYPKPKKKNKPMHHHRLGMTAAGNSSPLDRRRGTIAMIPKPSHPLALSLVAGVLVVASFAASSSPLVADAAVAFSIPTSRRSFDRAAARRREMRPLITRPTDPRAGPGRAVTPPRSSFRVTTLDSSPSPTHSPDDASSKAETTRHLSSRRAFASTFSAACAALLTSASCPYSALAANKPMYSQQKSDEDKIVRGYDRLQYLLDHWESETTVCNRGESTIFTGSEGKSCERTPEKVMQYLGYKSTDDPLFRVDKTLMRLQDVADGKGTDGEQVEYQDAMEKLLEKLDEGNGMAFVSSWGEANPGGGKDRVELFIERSRNDVVEARDSLATIIRVLGLR